MVGVGLYRYRNQTKTDAHECDRCQLDIAREHFDLVQECCNHACARRITTTTPLHKAVTPAETISVADIICRPALQ